MKSDTLGSFQSRHIGPDAAARDEMLRAVGVPSLEALIDQTIPPGIRSASPLELPPGESEQAYLRRLRTIASRNKVNRWYIGMGTTTATRRASSCATSSRTPAVHAVHAVPG